MSGKGDRIRISVTMTKTYVDALDHLVKEGLYRARGDAILEALRHFLRSHGIEPFAEPPKAEE